MRRVRATIPVLAVLTLVALQILSPAAARPESCPRGYVPLEDHGVAVRDDRGLLCVSQNRPESFREIAGLSGQRDAQALAPLSAAEGPDLYRASLAERAALIAATPAVPGANGRWAEYGKGPLLANDERFGTASEGLHELNGRIDSLDYDPVHKRLFASLGTGGVWMSTNLGQSWRSIGDNLPSQIVGAVGWTPAAGGSLVVVSGEPLVAGLSRTGIGGFYSRDLGKTWKRSKGLPDGALGFQVAVDPTKPAVVYIATSKGLFRSADAGASFANVKLPTGECAGKTDSARCLLANQVTDVVVQSPDRFGNSGGTVLAAVGYRASTRPFPTNSGIIESPENGLYRSDTGLPGSFRKLTATGFTPKDRIGRVEMGVAVGAQQDHDYVYAIVQDAVLLRGGFPTIDAPEDAWTGVTNTTLNGVYVSADFGDTWTKMGDTITISENPATGSALAVVGQALLFAPGVQAWYNEWIKPDPTRQTADGVPTRLTFGLEEVWQNELTDQPQNGPSAFKVIGRYFAGENCMLVLNVPACPTTRSPIAPSTTHPDQHDAIYVPDGNGGVTLVVGNDGGANTQHAAAGEEFDNTKWGVGANRGFYTLLPYHAQAAKDGTVWMGLQDNGSVKIEPGSRKQVMAFGGDGFFVAVDPNNSSYAWSETTFASMRVTTDGGISWSGAAPPISEGGQFSNPFVMDPLDANHLLTAGREVFETVDGPQTCSTVNTPAAEQPVECTWVEVFNLGTHSSPGSAGAESSGTSPTNTMSAVALHGPNAYVGFCGPCDIISTAVPYKMGLATNVGGAAPPAKASTSGWHVAAAGGLPNRTITAIEIDPANPKTVYVALGGYSGRSWRGPGTFGDKNKRIGKGHVFVSRDAGKTFTNISGRLPNAPANAIVKRGSQLLVGTDVGVFLSSDLKGTAWAALKGLPVVPVTSLQVMPGDRSRVLAATFGRGVWTYAFPRAGASRRPAVRGFRRELPATG
ncbi:MAG: hypothetical protein ACRDJM_01310, partial [Actinomycetota bacterium]